MPDIREPAWSKRLWSAISMEVPLLAARRKAEARFSDYILILEGSVAKIVKLEHAWRRLDGRN
ncbi:hypothetical protein ACFFIQ_20510, partial [Sphingobium indicum]|uniref:hypothetical protein n=1 Tax=Sphingobium indicum TaxID=332055 RepID=UPI0035ED2279